MRAKSLAAAAVVAVAALATLRRRYALVTVDGGSMLPAYEHGDRLVARRGAGRLTVGDVVVFERPRLGPEGRAEWPGGAHWMVKRVAALPGDPMPAPCVPANGSEPVPAGRLAVLGDNRAASADSRSFGLVPLSRVYGCRHAPRRTRGHAGHLSS